MVKLTPVDLGSVDEHEGDSHHKRQDEADQFLSDDKQIVQYRALTW